MIPCPICGIPWDSGFFDESSVVPVTTGTVLAVGSELVLARYQLHRNYCGVLTNFAQFTDLYASDNSVVRTPGYEWQLRCNGQPRDPYLTFDNIINPWGQGAYPVNLRLEAGCLIEFVIRRVSAGTPLGVVGGRITGRYWYNTEYGGAPNRL